MYFNNLDPIRSNAKDCRRAFDLFVSSIKDSLTCAKHCRKHLKNAAENNFVCQCRSGNLMKNALE